MKNSIPAAIALLGLFQVPPLAAADKVTYDFDKTKNFAHLRSFAVRQDTASDSALVDRRVAVALASALSARGLSEVKENPDVFIVPSRRTEMRKEITAYNVGYPSSFGPWYGSGSYGPWYGGWGWGGGWGTTYYQSRDLRYDTLVIDMVDATTGTLIWRGTGVQRVHSHWTPETIDKTVRKTVAKIVDQFPPTVGH